MPCLQTCVALPYLVLDLMLYLVLVSEAVGHVRLPRRALRVGLQINVIFRSLFHKHA